MTTPLLQALMVYFFNQLSFSVPRLSQFMITTEHLRFTRATLLFYHKGVFTNLDNPLAGTGPAWLTYFGANVTSRHLDWQVSSIAQILNNLRPLFSSVIDLTLDYREHASSSELHNKVDRTQWRDILGLFRNAEILRVHKGLVGEVSHSLRLDGEQSMELLPELKELVCPTGSVDDKTFASFVHDREVAGQLVKVIGEAFPVGRDNYYSFVTSTGVTYITQDSPSPTSYNRP